MFIKKLILWTPRILSILFIAVLFMFSFDVFDSNEAWYNILLAFLIHNIPVILLAFIVFLSWKRPMIGAITFFSLGILFSIYILIQSGFNGLSTVLTIGLPVILIGVLFWLSKKRLYLKTRIYYLKKVLNIQVEHLLTYYSLIEFNWFPNN